MTAEEENACCLVRLQNWLFNKSVRIFIQVHLSLAGVNSVQKFGAVRFLNVFRKKSILLTKATFI